MSYRALMTVALAAALPMAVAADDTHGKRYAGINVGMYDQDFVGNSNSASLSSLEGRIGGYVNENIALEGRLGLGLTGDEIAGRDVDLNYNFSVLSRVGIPVQKVFPYALVGFTRAEIGISNPDVDDSETDLSVGVGVDMNVNNLTLNVEYVQLVDKNDIDLSGFTFGFTTSF